jgi:hypothetical protein
VTWDWDRPSVLHPVDGVRWDVWEPVAVRLIRQTTDLFEALRYQDFGYHVERSWDDPRSTIPLFPRLELPDPPEPDWLGEGPVS